MTVRAEFWGPRNCTTTQTLLPVTSSVGSLITSCSFSSSLGLGSVLFSLLEMIVLFNTSPFPLILSQKHLVSFWHSGHLCTTAMLSLVKGQNFHHAVVRQRAKTPKRNKIVFNNFKTFIIFFCSSSVGIIFINS